MSLFVVGIIVTKLAARNRHHHATAAQEADYVGLIYDVSELAAWVHRHRRWPERVRCELIDLLHLRAARFEWPRLRPMSVSATTDRSCRRAHLES